MVGARWRIGSVGIVRAQCPWRRDVGCSIFLHPSGFPPLAVSGRVRLHSCRFRSPRFRQKLADLPVEIEHRPHPALQQPIFQHRNGERWIFDGRKGRDLDADVEREREDSFPIDRSDWMDLSRWKIFKFSSVRRKDRYFPSLRFVTKMVKFLEFYGEIMEGSIRF